MAMPKFFDFRDRLMVGPQTLNLSIYVRVVVSEQKTCEQAEQDLPTLNLIIQGESPGWATK